MENKPSFDRSLLIPIGVGIFSLLGICIILVAGRLNSSGGAVEQVPTATSFQYAFIGTEPAVSTVAVDESLTEAPVVLETPSVDFSTNPPGTQFIVFTDTPPSLITLAPIGNTSTPSKTPTSAFAAPFVGGTFDDVDSRFVYSGDWDRQSNVSGVRINGTLHVSRTLGNSVKFLFYGNELHVFFQAGPSLGTIRLILDNTSYVMPEAADPTQAYEWVLAATTINTHTVTITHESGGSVNFDGIIVPVIPTPVPSNTSASSQ
jgi:hypothetical protein